VALVRSAWIVGCVLRTCLCG